MSEKNHFTALQEIRCWNTDEVICALNYNGLSECVDACKKRDITGEKLLELSELTLELWKRDLSSSNIRKLAAFVRDISKMPAKYTPCSVSSNTNDDAWDTDFDDDETEEDSSQKTENNIPHEASAEKKLGVHYVSHKENGTLGVQNILNKVYNTQHSDIQLSSVNTNRNSQLRNKINIPSAFTSVHSTQNGSSTNSFLGKVSKPPFLKANDLPEPVSNDVSSETKGMKPTIPSRPQSLHVNSSKNIVRFTLPKPPAFDKEGSVIKELCDKLQLEPEDEYDSIEEERLNYLISQYNDAGGLPLASRSIQQNPLENPHKSPVPQSSGRDVNQQEAPLSSSLHRNQLYISKKNNSLPQPMSKADQNTVIENSKKSPILPPAQAKKLEEILQNPMNLPSANQEILRRSPVPLPPRNEKRQDISPSPILNHTSQNIINEVSTSGSSTSSRFSKEYDDNKFYETDEENGSNENTMQEQVYECIQEHESSKCNDIESCEYSGGYLVPKAPPSLPPKPQQASHNVKLLERLKKAESNVAGSSRSFGSLKHKPHQKTQEKSSQDGKKNNTLPMPRPFISESPRPTTSRPLPPPPPSDAGVQRVVKIPLVQMPWYFNVDRPQGEEILRNCEDGTFMIRPSTNTQNALTLTLKYGKRPFNICVRLRLDGRFALGTAKPTEQTFSSVEELVNHYTTNELLLYSNGKQAGIVVLTSPPRKDL